MKYFFKLIILTFLLTSCEQVIEPDLGEAESRVIIDGLMTNLPGPYKVRVTVTNSFYSTTPPPGVENALVIISDNEGTTDTLQHKINGEYYTTKIQGKVGNNYKLTVTTGGKTYESTQPMLRVTTFSGKDYKYFDQADFIHPEIGYYIYLVAIEPEETKDFYLWKFYKNGELVQNDDDINVASDETVEGGQARLQGPYAYALNDTAKVEMYSITEDAFKFYEGLNRNINNDGGFFSSPPSNPPSNISNGALGMFQVSAVDVAEIIIK